MCARARVRVCTGTMSPMCNSSGLHDTLNGASLRVACQQTARQFCDRVLDNDDHQLVQHVNRVAYRTLLHLVDAGMFHPN
jgi:hypothetical protein